LAAAIFLTVSIVTDSGTAMTKDMVSVVAFGAAIPSVILLVCPVEPDAKATVASAAARTIKLGFMVHLPLWIAL
jgi:hypothetical protein